MKRLYTALGLLILAPLSSVVVAAAVAVTPAAADPAPTPSVCGNSSISSNFNGTAINDSSTIWFNANASIKGVPSTGATITFDQSTITFTAGGTDYTVAVPAATITFSPGASGATTSFDPATGWTTTVPVDAGGNVFVSGVGFPLTTDLPGGINPVVWQGRFSSTAPGVTIQWKWGAAVYTSFSTDLSMVGAKPVDGSGSSYQNSDHAGTPESFKDFVIGGARGGGGSNFTGSWSGTKSVS